MCIVILSRSNYVSSMKYNTEMAAMHSDHYKQSVGFKIKKIFRRRATTASKEDECVELMKEEDQEGTVRAANHCLN